MNTIKVSFNVPFREIRTSESFRSIRTNGRICSRLDQVYFDRSGRKVNVVVGGDELCGTTLAWFDEGEMVERVNASVTSECGWTLPDITATFA